jgi:hypothetical protein
MRLENVGLTDLCVRIVGNPKSGRQDGMCLKRPDRLCDRTLCAGGESTHRDSSVAFAPSFAAVAPPSAHSI